MAKGEKGRRRPWRERGPQGPHKPDAGNGTVTHPKQESAGNRRGAFGKTRHRNEDDNVEDAPEFSDLSEDDIDVGGGSKDAASVQNDVAEFAAKLGLAVEGFQSSGFDDRDFRKPPKKQPEASQAKDSKKGKVADGKGGNAGGKGAQEGQGKKQAGSKDPASDEGGANKKKKGGEKKGALPPPPETGAPGEESAFAPADTFFSSGAGGVEDVPMGPWFEQAAALSQELLPSADTTADVSGKASKKKGKTKEPAADAEVAFTSWEELVAKMRAAGEGLLKTAAEEYEKGQRRNGKDVQWLVRARTAGTSADKVAAMTVMVQEDPVANVRSLDALLGMVSNKSGKRNAAIAIDALRELFVTSLLPNHKLKYLSQRPELETLAKLGKDGEPLLRFWCWEDALKQRYETFVTSLDALSRDNLQFLKEKALKTVFDLLAAKPEQEAKLLSALVNKLGDPERKIASKAGYLLARLLEQHPNMKRVVVQEVEAFVFRPHVGLRARYYAVVFLNQILLTKKGDGSTLAQTLIGLYFGLFKALTSLEAETDSAPNNFKKSLVKQPRQKTREVKKIIQSKKKRAAAKGAAPEDGTVGVDSRILSAILTGVNRAFPYVAADAVDALLQEHTPELFRMVHAGNFNVSVQALLLLHQLMSAHQAVSERFYRALYAVLLSPALAKSSKAALFLSVLFKAMKADLDSKRIAAFTKRLLQIATHQSPPFACGALLLTSEVLKVRPVLWGAIQQPEDKGDDLEHFEDVREETDATQSPGDVAKVDGPSPASKPDIAGPVLGFAQDDDVSDDDSRPSGSDEESDGDSDAEERKKRSADVSTSGSKSKPAPQEAGSSGNLPNGGGQANDTWPAKGRYDAKSREPSFCHAEMACFWELMVLAAHAHPSVAAMAKTLLAGANVLYDGDPLRDLALSIFLDRFVEKKPRAAKGDGKSKGASFMQPVRRGDAAKSHLLVGGEAFAAVDEGQVAAEDAFFYKFYTAKASKKPARKRGKGADSSDEDSDEERPSDKKARKAKKEKQKKKPAAGGSDEEIENVDSDDDALERILERGMGAESDDEGKDEPADEGEWDYGSLAKVLEKDDEADARLDDEESLEGGASDDDDEGGFEGFAAAGSDDDDVSGGDDGVSEDDGDDVSEDHDDVSGEAGDDVSSSSGDEGFDFGEDASESDGEELEKGAGKKGAKKVVGGNLEDGDGRKGKRNRSGRNSGALGELAETEGVEEEDVSEKPRSSDSAKGSKKRKKGGVGVSPFASMEEYAHLLD